MEHPDTLTDKSKKERQEKQKTISSTRIHPDDVFGAVAEKEEFIEPGKWVYSVEEHMYEDVLRPAYLEGFIATRIETINDRIHITVQELNPVNGDDTQ